MVNSIVNLGSGGLRDWLVQRLSAIYMAFFFITAIIYFAMHPNLTFGEWQLLLSHQIIKVSLLIFVLLMLMHTWVGMWTIFTDYIKPFALRAILNCFVLLTLLGCFFWSALILWSV